MHAARAASGVVMPNYEGQATRTLHTTAPLHMSVREVLSGWARGAEQCDAQFLINTGKHAYIKTEVFIVRPWSSVHPRTLMTSVFLDTLVGGEASCAGCVSCQVVCHVLLHGLLTPMLCLCAVLHSAWAAAGEVGDVSITLSRVRRSWSRHCSCRSLASLNPGPRSSCLDRACSASSLS